MFHLFVFGPRGVPHAFAKLGEAESKLIMLFQPAGKMEEWFNLVNDGVIATMIPFFTLSFEILFAFILKGAVARLLTAKQNFRKEDRFIKDV